MGARTRVKLAGASLPALSPGSRGSHAVVRGGRVNGAAGSVGVKDRLNTR